MQGNVRLWDFSGKKPSERSSFQAALNELHSLVYAPDRTTLAAGSGSLDGTVWLWDMMQPMPRVKLTLEGHDAPVDALAFSADCKLLATGSCDKTIRVWDLSDELPVERAVFNGNGDGSTSNPGKDTAEQQPVEAAVEFNAQDGCKARKVGEMCAYQTRYNA